MGICGMSSLLSPVQTPAAWGAVRGWVVSLSRRRATGGRQVMGVRGCVPAPTCSCGLSLNSQRTRPLSQQQAFSSVTLQPAPSNPLAFYLLVLLLTVTTPPSQRLLLWIRVFVFPQIYSTVSSLFTVFFFSCSFWSCCYYQLAKVNVKVEFLINGGV